MTISLSTHIHSGLRTLAGVCDGARQRDDVGFDGADTRLGHLLANKEVLSSLDLRDGSRLCMKYKRQLGEDFTKTLTMLELNTSTPEQVSRTKFDLPITPPTVTIDEILTSPLDSTQVLTVEQEQAIDQITSWLDTVDVVTPFVSEFKLGGYAGTGKTTLIKELRYRIRNHHHSVVAAFTGKAVHVLQRKGVSAQTLHSLMYDAVQDEDGTYTFHRKAVLRDDPGLVIVDEASMMSTELLDDLRFFKVKILWVGDPGQLEPVGTNPNLMLRPDLILSTIHRQAEQSPIINLATNVRQGKPIPKNFTSPDGALTTKPKVVSAGEFTTCDQIICAKNKTRQNLNARIRMAKGFAAGGIVVGDKLICLRNNRQLGVFNGMLFTLTKIHSEIETAWICDLTDELGHLHTKLKVWKEPFIMPLVQDTKVPYLHIYCDYGYVITCHKSQGSEWDSVIVMDEWMPPQVWDMKRWRYTAITRAAKKLTYCI